MRIACPTCAAAYEVPDALLAGGSRSLRCARCSTAFATPPPPASPSAVAPAPESRPGAAPTLPAPAPPETPPVALPATPPATPADAGPDAGPLAAPIAAAAPPAPEPLAPPRDRPPPMRGPAGPSPIAPEDAPVAPGQRKLAAAWLASLGVIGAGLAALVHWRAEVAAAWPPAARLFAALGLS